MTVKARWYEEIPASTGGDPFSEPETRVEDVGFPIDLRDEPRLNARLVSLLEVEAALYRRGVTCSIRDRDDTCCSACPVARTDSADPLWPLCRVGREQESVLTQLAVMRRVRAGDQA